MRTGRAILELTLLLRPLLQGSSVPRVVPRLLSVVALSLLTAFMGILVLAVGLYAGYLALLQLAALTQLQALSAVLAALVVMVVGLILSIRHMLGKIRPQMSTPVERITSTVDAFLDGFRRGEK